ncbi:MAG: M24 family metallopeptidase [Candidatus Gracilibacteria bacterium]
MQTTKTPAELYLLLQKVTNHIIAWAKPGMKMCELDAEARRMLGKYSEYFTHSLGHGVGIEIHESPRVSGKSREILRPGMVITIEPGIYGIKIQNTKDKIQNEESPRHSSQARNEREVESITNSVVYGLRYEEMVLVDKEKLIVL